MYYPSYLYMFLIINKIHALHKDNNNNNISLLSFTLLLFYFYLKFIYICRYISSISFCPCHLFYMYLKEIFVFVCADIYILFLFEMALGNVGSKQYVYKGKHC